MDTPLDLTVRSKREIDCKNAENQSEPLNLCTGPNSKFDKSGEPDLHSLKILEDYETRSPKFKIMRRNVVFKINPLPKTINPADWIKNAIQNITQYVFKNVNPLDKVGLSFMSENFNNPSWISFRKAEKLKYEDIWSLLSGVFQSQSEGLNTETFRIILTQVKSPVGLGRRRTLFYDKFDEECRKRKGIISINNKDNLCLARALVVGKAYAKNDLNKQKIRNNRGKIQDIKTYKLLKKSAVVIPEEGGGVGELRKFQQHLKKYKITVYKFGCRGREVVFEGTNSERKINLLLNNGHYNVITSLTSAFACSYYCEDCHTPHNIKANHRCKGVCPACQQKNKCQYKEKIRCQSCNRNFRNPDCYAWHISAKICDKIRACSQCWRSLKSNRPHQCNVIYCKICKKNQPENHHCFMQVDTRNPPLEKLLFIFYDIETTQETDYTNNSKLHRPNLCVFQQRCDICINEKKLFYCQTCGYRQKVLEQKPIENFVQHVLKQRSIFKHVIIIAHNGKSFDHLFVLKYIIEETSLKPYLILRGTKIILMQIDNIKFIDSVNYFPMKLSALPKAFELPTTVKKGYFPYLFNTEANQNYVGPMPAVEFYAPETMQGSDSASDDERKTFLRWYTDQINSNVIFDFRKELVEYCINDVEILAQACLKFRNIMLKECNVCPFIEAVTISSACNLIYRRNFLQENSIGIIPPRGYRLVDIQSKSAIKWLIEEAGKRQIKIKHAANSKEVIVSGIKVDGYCEETKQIFQFHGCYFHGHSCMTSNRTKPLQEDPTDTLESRLERTKTTTKRLQNLGYEVIEKWHCQYNSSISDDHPLLKYLPLNPRSAFYGGRTGNTVRYYKINRGEKICYIDICSLYPWVCKYGKFPTGHPDVIVGEECTKLNLNETDGLIKCTILPPRDLYHPVLPIKTNKRLMFLLCRSCGEQFNQGYCTHNEEERALSGVWVIDEVLKAIEKGYVILQVQEIWKYQIAQRNNENQGLFGSFIDKFLKMKTEASGWPENCTTSEQHRKYIENYEIREGIQLNNIFKNEGMRSLAKFCLNSFWGYIGRKNQLARTAIVREARELYDLLANPSIEVNFIQEINEEVVVVNWEYIEEAVEPLSTVNVCIAAYTTAQARLKLYSYLERLDNRVLYYDTDSIIYISKAGQYEPSKGEFLGDFTDELQKFGSGSYITEFCSSGPKSYSYTVFTPETETYQGICKIKGFTLNYEVSKMLNCHSMRDIILNEDFEEMKIPASNIRRAPGFNVITKPELKTFRPICVKRKFLENYNSLPYGHKQFCLNV